MKIGKIQLKNVKCFQNQTFILKKPQTDEPLSVCALVGANGSGKSTILKAIVAAFSVFASTYKGELFNDSAVSLENDLLDVEIDVHLSLDEKEILNYDESNLEICYRHKINPDEDEDSDMLMIPEQLEESQYEKYTLAIGNLLWHDNIGLIMYYDPFRYVSEKNPIGPNIHYTEKAKSGALLSNLNKHGENHYKDLDLKK